MTDALTGYYKIKLLAREKRQPVTALLALAAKNDPFYAGSSGSRQKAEWFARLWKQLGFSAGVHLRRMHYQLVSLAGTKKPDGLPYENTEGDWSYLCEAAKQARYLGLVAPEAFVDRRNPEPHLFRQDGLRRCPGWEPESVWWELPQIHADLSGDLDWALPGYRIYGYEYGDDLQPFHIEVWAEKSTMNDVLVPVCRRYGINLVTGLGFMSITSVIELLKRVADSGKPCRVFYVSDFDPAGDGMPTAVARQIEYWLHTYPLEVDIRLNPLVLTKEQVIAYKLPRTPIKETDRRKAHFEERYGEGAVELDALEALYPGELARLLEGAIARYRDDELPRKLRETRKALEEMLAEEWAAALEPYQGKLETLKDEVYQVVKVYQKELQALQQRLQQDLEPYEERLDSLRRAVEDAIDSVAVPVPPLPEPERLVEPDDWLFDSRRSYEEQLARYKARFGFSTGEKASGS